MLGRTALNSRLAISCRTDARCGVGAMFQPPVCRSSAKLARGACPAYICYPAFTVDARLTCTAAAGVGTRIRTHAFKHVLKYGLFFDHPRPVAIISIVCNTGSLTRFCADVDICVSQLFLAEFVLRRTACHADYEVDIDHVCAEENRR